MNSTKVVPFGRPAMLHRMRSRVLPDKVRIANDNAYDLSGYLSSISDDGWHVRCWLVKTD